MDVLVFMIPGALALGVASLAALLWAMKSGQFEDLDGAEYRILSDDDQGTNGPDAAPEGLGPQIVQ